MSPEGNDIWSSSPLILSATENKIKVVLNENEYDFKVKINLGVEEEDLF